MARTSDGGFNQYRLIEIQTAEVRAPQVWTATAM
jgi:hypothetical protein